MDTTSTKRDNADKYVCPIRPRDQWADEETGLYYNRFRYYDPDAAQYMSPDPIGLMGGFRSQGYVDSPLRWTDPMGLAPLLGGPNFKSHFLRHKSILEKFKNNKYKKWKCCKGQEFLEDAGDLIDDGTLKPLGEHTLRKGQSPIDIYTTDSTILGVKKNGEFVRLLDRAGGGMAKSIADMMGF